MLRRPAGGTADRAASCALCPLPAPRARSLLSFDACVALAQAPALATPGLGTRTRLRARKQDRGPPGLPNTPQVVVERAQVRFPNGYPRAPPCARSHLHLHLGTERLQGLGLPGWTWLSQHWTLPGIWALRLVWLQRAAERKLGPRAGTPGGSLLHLNVCPLLPPLRPRCHLPLLCPADSTPHPARSPNSDFKPKCGQACLGQVTASRRSGLR